MPVSSKEAGVESYKAFIEKASQPRQGAYKNSNPYSKVQGTGF